MKTLADVKTQRGILQGNALSPLQFVIAMMPPNHIFENAQGAINELNRKK